MSNLISKFKRMGKIKKILLSIVSIVVALFLIIFIAACIDVANDPPKPSTTAALTVTETTISDSSSAAEAVASVVTEPKTTASAKGTEAATTTQTTTKPTTAKATTPPITKQPGGSGGASTSVPSFSGKAYVALNDNTPLFAQSEVTTKSFERYSNLDSLGRCGVAYACVGKDIMPTEERGAIGSVKPSGWHTVKYDCVDGKYLYNRCHLIGFQLTGENANEKNLITGTRYLNIEGMLPFENMVADYVKETGNHVMYRVTPVFSGNNLLASGVKMEGYSVEDKGEGICFFVYCYNVQPQVTINYANGESHMTDGSQATTVAATTKKANATNQADTAASQEAHYILNTNTKKFHLPTCSSVTEMKESNKKEFSGTRDELIAQGYEPCGRCHP